MTPLKAVVEPMLMRARRQAMMLVAATALTGIEVLSLTWLVVSAAQFLSIHQPYLAQVAPAWQSPVSRKGPTDTRSRS